MSHARKQPAVPPFAMGDRLRLSLVERVAAWDWDVRADRLYLCPRAASFFRVSRIEGAEGLPIGLATLAIHPDDAPRVNAAIAETCERGGRFETCYRIEDVDGKARRLQAFGACILDEQGVAIRFPGVLIDLSDEDAAEPGSLLDVACDHLFAAREAALQAGDMELGGMCESALMHLARAAAADERHCHGKPN